MDPVAAEAAGPSIITLVLGGGGLSCFAIVITLYNLWTAITMMRSTEEGASGLSKAAWAVSVLAYFTGPCGLFFALVAVIMSRIETGRVWREESPISSATPCRMASINAAMLVLFTIFLSVFAFAVTR
jgi:hypothetical protein